MERERSCGAVIFRRSGGTSGINGVKYLLLLYDAGHWDFAKGHAEEGENEEATIRREVKEEAGITDLRFVKGFNERISYFFRNGSGLVLKEVTYLLAETKAKNVKLSFEHKEFVWLDYDAAVGKVTHKTAKDLLNKANNMLAGKED